MDVHFECLPINYAPPTRTTTTTTTVRFGLRTMPVRKIPRKSDYLKQDTYEVVGSLISTTEALGEYRILKLLTRPHLTSRDYFDYTVKTVDGIQIQNFNNIPWLADGSSLDISNLSATYTVSLLDDFQ